MSYLLESYRAYFKLLFAVSADYASAKAYKLFSTPRMKKMKSHEVQILNTAQSGAIFVKNYFVKTYRWKGGSKKALLVHGWEGNAGSLGNFVQPLVDAGYTVISFDGPGHFNSTVKQTNLVHYSNVIAEIVRRENIEVILAHSFGGASSVVALHGNNDLQSVKKLVLMGSPNRLINVIDHFASMMKFTKENKRSFINYLNKRFKRDIETVAVETYLQKLTVETLIVHDSLDRVVPYSGAVSVAAHNPNALLFTTEKAGHYKMLWNETIKNRVAEFVGKADNGAWEYDKLHLFKRTVNKN